MYASRTIFGVFCLGYLLLGGSLFAQDDELLRTNVIKERSVLLRTLEQGSQTYQTFPNINQRAYFENERALRHLRELEAEGTAISSLDQALESYISQFGIENFRRDSALLWLAGRVKQALGDSARAIFYYELARLHHRGRRLPRLRLDSLLAERRSEWLPIDEYYQLLEVRKRIDPLIPPKNVLTSMGQMINSPDPEYAPYMHPSDSILIFTSRRDPSGRRARDIVDPFSSLDEDLYYTEIDFRTGEWQPASKLSEDINSKFNEGSACLSPDGVTLFFTRCHADKGYGSCDLYQAEYDRGAWINIRNLGKQINSESWDSQPNISADGRKLFFASNRKGGFGGTDIYVTEKSADGSWGPAQNLGPIINSPREEVTPYYHNINNTLYFSSTGHLTNFGSFDIYKSRWFTDRWEFPKNVGPLVNTKGNEYYFSIDGEGKTIFYANARDPEEDHVKQNFDLYSFPMPMEARPDAIAQLKGVLVDSVSGHVLQGTVMIIDLENGVEVAPKEINENGYFEFDLRNNNKYRIYVLGDNFLTIKNDFYLDKDTSFQVMTQSFEENKPIVFESMEFKSNSARLLSNVKPKLDYIVRFLRHYPMFKLEVEGHTDADGPEGANLKLSRDRAERIRNYILKTGGFDLERVSAVGYGETRPLVPNDSEENKQRNRRVEFKLELDELYDGDMWLPTQEELEFGDELESDSLEELDDGFEMSEEERNSWEEEMELDDLDLDAELEADILESVDDDDDDPHP